VGIHGARVVFRAGFPDFVKQGGTCLDATAALVQRPQQFHLERRERDLLAVHPRPMRASVHAQAAKHQFVLGLGLGTWRARARAPQDSLHAQNQLPDTERLDHIVVGAQLEAHHAIDFLTAGR
jgi:hypothetical protein